MLEALIYMGREQKVLPEMYTVKFILLSQINYSLMALRKVFNKGFNREIIFEIFISICQSENSWL